MFNVRKISIIAVFISATFVPASLHPSVVPAAMAQDRFAAPDAAYREKDFVTAHKLWLGLAEEGNASAYFNLGRLYLFGEGVAVDLIEAYKWFKMADTMGVPQAKSGLSRVRPLLTPDDLKEAERRIARWYESYPATRP